MNFDATIREDINGILSSNLPWEKLNGKHIVISGANGFLPSYFVFVLLERNARFGAETRITAICRSSDRARDRFAGCLDDKNLRIHIQDMRFPIDGGIKPDICIHGASPAGILSRHEFPADTFETNLLGCRNLLELRPTTHMFISSVDVYGSVAGTARLTEDDSGHIDALNARNGYALGKRAAEALCALYSAQYGINMVIARPFQVYGPGMAIGDGRLHGDFISQIKNAGKIVLTSDGKAKRSFMYIADAIEAMFTILLRGEKASAYNVVDESGEETVLGLARIYAEKAGNAPVEFDYERHEAPEATSTLPCVIGSSEKLRQLGWKPKTSLQDGVARTYDYYI
jgi:nucleoside-diphosphate-sugar epimerase